MIHFRLIRYLDGLGPVLALKVMLVLTGASVILAAVALSLVLTGGGV